ncbi:MAG: YiiD C-terminal domain-containing protein [bacterium]|nr:YiiD C-terminal domain-containing protein [bacterium]
MICAADVESYLHQNIPLSRQMGIRVTLCDNSGVRLTAPLEPNVNHMATVFGGSASAVAMLCGWGLMHARIAELPFATELVIRRNQMEFDSPLDGDFDAWCAAPDADTLAQFDTALIDEGKARLQLDVDLLIDDRCAAAFVGTYVAVKK